MQMFIISGYVAICIALFALLRIPLNRWTLPTASVGGAALVFATIQLLTDSGYGLRSRGVVDGDSDQLGTGVGECQCLLHGRLDVCGIGIRHRLHGDGCAAADPDAVHFDADAAPPPCV